MPARVYAMESRSKPGLSQLSRTLKRIRLRQHCLGVPRGFGTSVAVFYKPTMQQPTENFLTSGKVESVTVRKMMKIIPPDSLNALSKIQRERSLYLIVFKKTQEAKLHAT